MGLIISIGSGQKYTVFYKLFSKLLRNNNFTFGVSINYSCIKLTQTIIFNLIPFIFYNSQSFILILIISLILLIISIIVSIIVYFYTIDVKS